jgi:DNA polymerase III subunit delta
VAESAIGLFGNNEIIVNDALHALVAETLNGLDPAMALEDFTVNDDTLTPDERDSFVQRIVTALNTPPFLVPHRVVVVRNAFALAKANVEVLSRWIEAPVPEVTLILAGTTTKSHALLKVVGRTIDTTVGFKEGESFVKGKLRENNLRVDPAAIGPIMDRLGEEVERVDALARTLWSVFGEAKIGFAEIEPYLGAMGNVPEWDLTDCIDRGRTAEAVKTARRMLDSEGRVPVQVVGILQRHYLRLAQLQNSGAATTAAVVSLLGIKEYPAKKLLGTFNALGTDRVARALQLVAQADIDLKGATALQPTLIMEILVARLAKMSEGAGRR